MRLSKSERHWKHWNRLHNSSHNRFLRMLDVWRRFFRVRPCGYEFNFDRKDSGEISFEKA